MTANEVLGMQWNLDSSPEDISWVRARAHATMTGWRCPTDTVDTVLLVLSELVTNAVVHAAPRPPGDPPQAQITVMLTTLQDPQRIRVEVTDSSPVLPTPRHSGDDDEHGRGLILVAALTSGWGVAAAQADGSGKCVWAEVPVIEQTPHPATHGAPGTGCTGTPSRRHGSSTDLPLGQATPPPDRSTQQPRPALLDART